MDGVKTTGPAPAPQVASSSEYERQRDENMRQNHAKLCALGLGAPFLAQGPAAALELRADGSAGAKLWLHPSLAFVDIYMLAGAGCAVASCLAPDGCSVRIEVGSGADVRVLELPMPLPPVCDEPQRREFFDCSGGVWWLRWMLEARRRHARMTICSTPPPSTPRNPPHTGCVEAGPAAWSCGPTHAH